MVLRYYCGYNVKEMYAGGASSPEFGEILIYVQMKSQNLVPALGHFTVRLLKSVNP